MRLNYACLIGQTHVPISKLQSFYKVHLNMISNGELSDPLCDSVNRDFGQIVFSSSSHKG